MLALPFLSLLAVLRVIVPGVQPPCWDLASAALVPGEGVWVLLKDPDDIPPVLSLEVRVQEIPRARGPRATRRGAGASLC